MFKEKKIDHRIKVYGHHFYLSNQMPTKLWIVHDGITFNFIFDINAFWVNWNPNKPLKSKTRKAKTY